jgi:hypothetical protein
MSHSAPSESSAIDPMFVVGTDLVEFDRRDLPIYLTPETHWADACDDASYGAPLDRLYGEPGDVYVDGVLDGSGERLATSLGEDPLISLAGLSEGDGPMAFQSTEPASPPAAAAPPVPEIAAIYDFGADSHVVVHVHDGWSWEAIGTEWAFEHA